MSDLAGQALTLEISRRFDASPERVFDAWLTPDWGAWLPPRGFTCAITDLDPRPGGRFHMHMTAPDGRDIETHGTYREIDRPHRLVFDWWGECLNLETRVTLTFHAEGGGTRMTLLQEGFTEDAMRGGFHSGWTGEGGSFDKLAAALGKAVAHG